MKVQNEQAYKIWATMHHVTVSPQVLIFACLFTASVIPLVLVILIVSHRHSSTMPNHFKLDL